MCRTLSSCRLYSWIRLIWLSKIVSGSTLMAQRRWSQSQNSTLAWRLAAKKALRKPLSSALLRSLMSWRRSVTHPSPMAAAAGEENFFLFGLTAEQVQGSRGWYDPRWHYEREPETRRALDLMASGALNRGESGIHRPIWDALLTHGDYYMHLADLSAYVRTQEQVGQLYRQPEAWARRGSFFKSSVVYRVLIIIASRTKEW